MWVGSANTSSRWLAVAASLAPLRTRTRRTGSQQGEKEKHAAVMPKISGGQVALCWPWGKTKPAAGAGAERRNAAGSRGWAGRSPIGESACLRVVVTRDRSRPGVTPALTLPSPLLAPLRLLAHAMRVRCTRGTGGCTLRAWQLSGCSGLGPRSRVSAASPALSLSTGRYESWPISLSRAKKSAYHRHSWSGDHGVSGRLIPML